MAIRPFAPRAQQCRLGGHRGLFIRELVKSCDQRHNFFNNRIASTCNDLPNEITVATSVNRFKNTLDEYLNNKRPKLLQAVISCWRTMRRLSFCCNSITHTTIRLQIQRISSVFGGFLDLGTKLMFWSFQNRTDFVRVMGSRKVWLKYTSSVFWQISYVSHYFCC